MGTFLSISHSSVKKHSLFKRVANWCICLFSIALSVVGIFWLVNDIWAAEAHVEMDNTITVNGLTVQLQELGWISADMHSTTDADYEQTAADASPDSASVAMPSSMMPGLPETGLERLKVILNLKNEGSQLRQLAAGQFRVEDQDNNAWPIIEEQSGRNWQLAPGQEIELVLYFEVKSGAARLAVVWEGQGDKVNIPIEDAPTTNHSH